MQVSGKSYRTIWVKEGSPDTVQIIDQTRLPYAFEVVDLKTLADVCKAIKEMQVRGAPLIGVCAAFGVYLAIRNSTDALSTESLKAAGAQLVATRPTAVNLTLAVQETVAAAEKASAHSEQLALAFQKASELLEAEVRRSQSIGMHGVKLIEEIFARKKGPVQILTHCNAGWLACVDYGTATAPIYEAVKRGIDLHVWVDETRPRNQGARLTAWELGHERVKHTVIADNTGGHLMQRGMVDMVIVGTDRTTVNGDVANKIGTYLKALAAFDNKIPFYVALPSSSFDWGIEDGSAIVIEERSGDEVSFIEGELNGALQSVRLTPMISPALNYGFDITPARLVTGFITEYGVCGANETELRKMLTANRPYEANQQKR